MSFEIINPGPLGRPSGWNHGLLAPSGGRVLFLAGQTAPDRAGLAAQWEGALERILLVLRAAGGGPEDVGRVTAYVTDKAAYLAARTALGAIHRRLMGTHYPAMALVEVRALVDEGALVELEATAVIP
jgi:enamine deaminase RidA (YjgF/YER057c/UK114 family)